MARKTEKGGKFRNVHCRTWNMARKLKNMENEKHPLDDSKKNKSTYKEGQKEIIRPILENKRLTYQKTKTYVFALELEYVSLFRREYPPQKNISGSIYKNQAIVYTNRPLPTSLSNWAF